jgi:cell division septal protein FtsQ
VKRALLVSGAAVLLLLAGVGGFKLIRKLSFFSVKRIELVGAHYLTPATMARALAIPRGMSIFDGTRTLERRAAQVDGVVEARVTRRLPGTIRVTVREAEPVALAERSGRLVPVDQAGRALPFDPTRPAEDLPLAEADSAVAGLLARMRETEPELFARVERGARVKRDVALDLAEGRLWFRAGATSEEIRHLVLVAEYLNRRGRAWRELDARFASRIIVRGAGA